MNYMHRSLRAAALALAGNMAASKYYRSPDGVWKFAYSADPDVRPRDCMSRSRRPTTTAGKSAM